MALAWFVVPYKRMTRTTGDPPVTVNVVPPTRYCSMDDFTASFVLTEATGTKRRSSATTRS